MTLFVVDVVANKMCLGCVLVSCTPLTDGRPSSSHDLSSLIKKNMVQKV